MLYFVLWVKFCEFISVNHINCLMFVHKLFQNVKFIPCENSPLYDNNSYCSFYSIESNIEIYVASMN